MQDGTRVTALEGVRRITKRLKLVVVRFEELPGGFSLDFKYNDHKCSHQEGTVSHLVVLVAAVMEKSVVFVLGIGKEPYELPDELVNHGQI